MDVSNICFTSWISPPSLPNRYQKCGVNLDWMIDPPLMSVCVSLWPAVHSDGEYVGEQTVNACLYIRVFLMHMNSNVLLGFEVLQRWYFMHLGSPRPCAPPPPATWRSSFVFSSSPLCHLQVCLPPREHSTFSVIIQQCTDGRDCYLNTQGIPIPAQAGTVNRSTECNPMFLSLSLVFFVFF